MRFAKSLGASVVVAALAAFGSAGSASADPSYTFASPGTVFTNGQWSLGFEFSPNSTVVVNQLAIFDDGNNNGSTHDVGIYDASGNLLASTTITQGTNYSNFFDWSAIAGLTLIAGQDYYIAEQTGTSNYTYDTNGFAMNSDITYITDAFTASATLVFPNGGCCSVTDGYFGPNFNFIRVPEPATLAVFAVGLVGAAGFGRRRKANKTL